MSFLHFYDFFFFSLSYLSNSVLDLIVGKSQQFFLILQNPVEFEIDLTGLMFFYVAIFYYSRI
jgi:hypothetical protein